MIVRIFFGLEEERVLHTVLKIVKISLGGACKKISQARFEWLRFKN